MGAGVDEPGAGVVGEVLELLEVGSGGAAAHWSRGYFGKPVDQVVQEMRAERYGEPSGTWVRVAREDGNAVEGQETG
jgi:hypothetical protein